jgi:hypothetical protein
MPLQQLFRGSAADGVTFWHTLYLGTTRYNMAPGTPDPAPDALFPMAFLVEQDPGGTANAHFHRQDQFQLVVGGYGMLGRHEVRPVTVHFTGAHTAYGPIRASEDEGVAYFTLRNGFDPGARFMTIPENRVALRTIPGRRHRESVAGPLGNPGASAENPVRSRPGRHDRVALQRGAGGGCHRPRSGERTRPILGRDWRQPEPRRRNAAKAFLCIRLSGRCRVPRGRRAGRLGSRRHAVSRPVIIIDERV